MRVIKIVLLLSLTILTSACQKDPIQPVANTSSPTHTTTTKDKANHVDNEKSEKPKDTPKVNPSKETKKQKTTTVQTSQPKTDKTSGQNSPAKQTTTTSTTPSTKVNKEKASIQVNGYQGKTILPTTSVVINEGDTALDITKRVLKARDIAISVRGSGATAYVEGIDDEFEFDHGPSSGWMILVNGHPIDRSAGTITIKKGDQIVWKYSTTVTGGNG